MCQHRMYSKINLSDNSKTMVLSIIYGLHMNHQLFSLETPINK